MAFSVKNPLNIAVLISGYGSNLQAIIDQLHVNKSPVNVAIVVSDRPDAVGLERAKKADIPTGVLEGKEFSDNDQYDQALIDLLEQHHVDLVVLAGFMRILGPRIVQRYSGQMLNIHPALLPKYIGSKTHERVLEAGDTEHGTTVHFVTEKCDEGPIILQESVAVLASDNVESLRERVQAVEHRIYPQVIRGFADGKIPLGPEGMKHTDNARN